jgi:hypothetical protein
MFFSGPAYMNKIQGIMPFSEEKGVSEYPEK